MGEKRCFSKMRRSSPCQLAWVAGPSKKKKKKTREEKASKRKEPEKGETTGK